MVIHLSQCFALALVLSFVPARLIDAQVAPPRPTAGAPETIQLYTSADESSPLADAVRGEEIVKPLAETVGADGIKWFLVQTKHGSTGWIKSGDAETAKKIESYFKSLPPEPSSIVPMAISTISAATATRNAVVVPVQVTGTAVVVPVVLNRSVSAYLLLDTGATSTLISRRLATKLALQEVGSRTGLTVSGPLNLPVARLESLKAGDAEVTNLQVAIHDFHPDPRIDGLLGLDFLSRFNVSLDPHKHLLVLDPR